MNGSRRHLEAALRYAEHGWAVIPVHHPHGGGCSCGRGGCTSVGKHPRTSSGLNDATRDPGAISRWWTRWPNANIAVATGPASGLLVLDIDLPTGPASLDELTGRHGALPDTCAQRTGSGGRQLLFAHPDAELGNRAGVVPGIDVRAGGGYIVVPPSVHVDGPRYEWTNRRAPAEPPAWLVEVVRSRAAGRDDHAAARTDAVPRLAAAIATGSRYAGAAARGELEALTHAEPGTRNDRLNRAAFSLGQLVGARLLDQAEIVDRLREVGQQIGLGPREVERTISSGLHAGMASPRATTARAISLAAPAAEVLASAGHARKRVR